MITPMMKYSLVLFHKEYRGFLDQLSELGLVDITTSTWEPSDDDRKKVTRIEKLRVAIETVTKLQEQGAKASIKFVNKDEAIAAYDEAAHKLEELNSEIIKVTKQIEELRPWGEFDITIVDSLRDNGIALHFFTLSPKEFENVEESWRNSYSVTEINRDAMLVYIIVAAPVGEQLTIDAQETKAPTSDIARKNTELETIKSEIARNNAIVISCIPFLSDFMLLKENLSNELHIEKVAQGGQREAEGTLILLEGWATTESQVKVDQMLEDQGVFYIKDRPTPEDMTPVLLKNNKFARLFEFIGGFYSLPKYSTTDMTPYFAPFYMIFFGFCLGDGGYGLLFVLGGLYMALKVKGSMTQVGWLTVWCGGATMLFGLLTGSFFGIQLANMEIFSSVRDKFLTPDKLFTLAIAVGFVHLIFGMLVRIVSTARMYGIKYALSTIGWVVVIISSLAAYLLPDIGVNVYTFSSLPYQISVGVGFFMMMFLNSPGKNPFVNFGSGLWNTYNDITGLMGDILSYIRLFALGLSGGILALVFNDLALGLSPDIPVVRQLVMIMILIIGHGINIFMSSLGSFVHPMRLTFVEFYKNAGFEAGQRSFNPLRKNSEE